MNEVPSLLKALGLICPRLHSHSEKKEKEKKEREKATELPLSLSQPGGYASKGTEREMFNFISPFCRALLSRTLFSWPSEVENEDQVSSQLCDALMDPAPLWE